jgi:hypothetical protein
MKERIKNFINKIHKELKIVLYPFDPTLFYILIPFTLLLLFICVKFDLH